MAKIYATIDIAILGNYPKYRQVEIDDQTRIYVELCNHDHDTRDEAEDCPDARKARGVSVV